MAPFMEKAVLVPTLVLLDILQHTSCVLLYPSSRSVPLRACPSEGSKHLAPDNLWLTVGGLTCALSVELS